MFSKKAMQHTRQAPGRDIHKHFSLAPARSHTITASNKASATAATRNPPPHPDPYKTGPKLAKRRRGHHTCHSTLSLPPAHPPPLALLHAPSILSLPPVHPLPLTPSHAPPHLKPRTGTDGEGRRDSARLCVAAVRRSAASQHRNRTAPPLGTSHRSQHSAGERAATRGRQQSRSRYSGMHMCTLHPVTRPPS